jgi:SpoVK/Ycf46/Vps4 family AAA+-type ATPase
MGKRIALLLALVVTAHSFIAQVVKKPVMSQELKITGADSLLPVPVAVKEQLGKFIDFRKKQVASVHLYLTGADSKTKINTGRWLAARLQKNIYRISLSAVVSKYIEETEKNLNKIFAAASMVNAVLFFDEADALFGKRTTNTDANNKFDNQEISYLLDKIEKYEGIAILACNSSADCIKNAEVKGLKKIAMQ